MADTKYGRVFTEADVERLLLWACPPGEQVSLGEVLERMTLANEGVDPSHFPADEPLMLLRGQDECALPAIGYYRRQCEARGADQDHLDAVRRAEVAFRNWAGEHGTKIPDTDAA